MLEGAAADFLGDDVPEGPQRRVVQEDEAWPLLQVLLHTPHLHTHPAFQLISAKDFSSIISDVLLQTPAKVFRGGWKVSGS